MLCILWNMERQDVLLPFILFIVSLLYIANQKSKENGTRKKEISQ